MSWPASAGSVGLGPTVLRAETAAVAVGPSCAVSAAVWSDRLRNHAP